MTAAALAERPQSERWRLLARRIRGFAQRFLRRRDGMAGLLILLFFAVIAIAPHVFVGPLETATTATAEPFDSPSSAHLFGADELGRDMLNRTVHGARISMLIGLLATLVTVFLGVFVGIIAGFVGGLLDSILMRIADFFLVLPTFVLALILAPVLIEIVRGPGIVLRHPRDAARDRRS